MLVITQNANSMPQFFGQSAAAESSGKVVSRSIASGSNGFNGIPEIFNDLLPPLLPNEAAEVGFLSDPLLKRIPVLSLEVEPPPLPSVSSSDVPVTTTTTTTTTTTRKTTTTRPFVQTTTVRIAPVQRPQTSKFQQHSAILQSVNGKNGFKSFGSDGKYKVKGESGAYRPKGNLGYYTHNNAGSYTHDDRGKYRKN